MTLTSGRERVNSTCLNTAEEGVRGMAQPRLPIARHIGLSELEARCLRLYGAGCTREEISNAARVSRRTVGAVLTVAKEKLGARSLAHAALLLSGLSSELEFMRE